MGNKQSSETNITQTLDSVSQNLSNIMLSIKQTTSCQQSINQSITLDVENMLNCDVNILNTAKAGCKLSSMFNTSTSNNISSLLKQAVDQSAKSGTKQVQDTLSMPANTQNTNTNINVATRIKDLIELNFSTDFSNTCISQSTAKQDIPVKIKNMDCSKKGSLNLSNDLELFALVNCVSDHLTEVVKNDELLKSVTQSSESKTDASQEGLGTVFNNLVNMFGRTMVYAVIAVVIVIIVIIIGALIFLTSDSGNQLANKALDKA